MLCSLLQKLNVRVPTHLPLNVNCGRLADVTQSASVSLTWCYWLIVNGTIHTAALDTYLNDECTDKHCVNPVWLIAVIGTEQRHFFTVLTLSAVIVTCALHELFSFFFLAKSSFSVVMLLVLFRVDWIADFFLCDFSISFTHIELICSFCFGGLVLFCFSVKRTFSLKYCVVNVF